jgi:3-deoxy-manno-octulosonate cytidylyltransferase (CMP-KDO synthetase)
MSYTIVIPARLASTRLPRKPLAEIEGVPMVVRVAQRCRRTSARTVVVAADSPEILAVCQAHGVSALLTRRDHATGSDRLAEACSLLGLGDQEHVINVQGDEPFIEPDLVEACARLLITHPECVMSTAAHPIDSVEEWLNPNVVKVVTDRMGKALYFSRAPIPWWRDGYLAEPGGYAQLPNPAPLRHVGLYGYTAGFLRRFPTLPVSPHEQTESLEQLRVLWHGERIAVHVSSQRPGPGVDTPEDLERVRQMARENPHLWD